MAKRKPATTKGRLESIDRHIRAMNQHATMTGHHCMECKAEIAESLMGIFAEGLVNGSIAAYLQEKEEEAITADTLDR